MTLFADDCRIMKRVKIQKDYEKLQHDLTEMCSWMKENLLIINEDKSQKITFSRLSEIFTAEYYIGNRRFKEVDYVRDLRVYLDKAWTFDVHVDRILARAHRTLGFINRITYNYYSIDPIIYLFKTLILTGLNLASIIWRPRTKGKYDMLTVVIRKFLRYVSYKSGKPLNFDDHDYWEISRKCAIYTLESR